VGVKNTIVVFKLFFFLIFFNEYANACSGYFNHYYVLEDVSKNLSINEILNRETDFVELDNLSFGYSKSAFWIRLPLDIYNCEENIVFITTSNPTINYVDYYLVRNNEIVKEIHTGSFRKKENKEYPFNKFLFEVKDFERSDYVLVRYQNIEGAFKTNISYKSTKAFFSYIQRGNFITLFLFGIIFFQFLFALAQSYLYREKLLYWYCGFVLSIIIHQIFNLGYGQFFLPEQLLKYTNMLKVFAAPIFMATLTGFTYYLFDVKQLFKEWLSKLFWSLIFVHLLFAVLAFIPFPTYPVRFYILSVFMVFVCFTVLILLAVAIISSKKGHLPSYYYLIVHIPVGFILLFHILINYGVVQYLEIYSFTYLGLAFFEVLISLVLLTIYIKRIESARNEKRNISSTFSTKTTQVDEISDSYKAMYNLLNEYFVDEQPYLNSNLKILDVAEKLNTSVHELSKAINLCGKMHFSDFINSYRVEYSKTLLQSPEHVEKFTIETIAHQSGFNNRASFNNSFKRFAKKTPSEFKKNN
jgi:AraC-like DNA-binding protein